MKQKVNPKASLGKVAVFIGILLLAVILFDPLSLIGNFIEQHKSLNDLANAKALWEKKGITSYQIKVHRMAPLGCILDAILTFHDGELVDVRTKPVDENSDYVMLEKQKWSDSACNFTQLSIPQVFSETYTVLSNINPLTERLTIAFDPTYGFTTRYQFRYNGYGLFTSVLVSDCCPRYEFSDFQPIK